MANRNKDWSVHWRATTSRLLLSYGLFFAIWGTVLLGSIYWETIHYLEVRTDRDLVQQISYLKNVDSTRLPTMLDDYVLLEDANYNAWGLFDAHGNLISGDVVQLPRTLKIDGDPMRVDADTVIARDALPSVQEITVIAAHLDDHRVLALAHTTGVTAHVSGIIKHALLWGISFTLVPGLLGGLILNRAPRRRIRQIESATKPIMQGDLRQRLPVSHRGDELDRLAAIINDVLDQIERLMGEVKGVCDNIAHDLRTPLTRLRSQLYRVEQSMDESDPHAELIQRCVSDVDDVLARFRALLRISELEDRRRREGFVAVDLGSTLQHVHELYAPLAEDQRLHFTLHAEPDLVTQADPDLLFEALGNLVGNAIKFTPTDGHVALTARRISSDRARVEVVDSGPGIPEEQRQAVWQRFYRGDASRGISGHGLGLSIVAAVAKLHDFELHIDNAETGTRISLDVRLPPKT